MASSEEKGFHQVIGDPASHAIVIQLAPPLRSVSRMKSVLHEAWNLDPVIANLVLQGRDVSGVPGATLASPTANPVIAVAKEVQMKTLVLDPVTARKTLKEQTAAAANLASSICRSAMPKDVMSVSVRGFPPDVKVPTGPMAAYKT